MAIFVNENTRLVVQGITGRDGSFHTYQMMEYGTDVVAGVTPGKGVPATNYCYRVCREKPECNENRTEENASNCSSSVPCNSARRARSGSSR